MDENTMVVAIMGQICGTVFLVTILTLWFRRRRADATPQNNEGLHRIEARLSEMQQAIDSVAVEVERISEGQRFTAKLLAERGQGERQGADGARVAERQGIPR